MADVYTIPFQEPSTTIEETYLSTHLNGLIDLMLSFRISEFRRHGMEYNNAYQLEEFNTISIGLSRRSGQTQAIKNVILKRFSNSLIFFNDRGMIDNFINMVILDPSLRLNSSIYIYSRCITFNNSNILHRLQCLSLNMDLSDIIDEIENPNSTGYDAIVVDSSCFSHRSNYSNKLRDIVNLARTNLNRNQNGLLILMGHQTEI